MKRSIFSKEKTPALIAGTVLSAVIILLHGSMNEKTAAEFAAIVLAVIGSVYFGFALRDKFSTAVVTEVITGLLFVLAAGMGLWISQWFIISALLLHGIWDIIHHANPEGLVDIPAWYIPFCVIIDFAFGLYLLFRVVF